MIKALDQREFRFSGVADVVYKEDILNFMDYENLLNDHINISDYTEKVKVFYFIPLITDHPEREKECLEYDSKKQEVYIQKLVDPGSNILTAFFNALHELFEEEEWVEAFIEDVKIYLDENKN